MAKETKAAYDKDKGKHRLKSLKPTDDKHTDVEGIDTSKHEVFDSDKNLSAAQSKYPNYDWFACFTIKDKSGNQVGDMPAYTIKVDKPASGKNLYYYYNNTANQLDFSDAGTEEGRQRVKATLRIGDPPIGTG
jgi:hypothetical protein